MPIVRRYLDRLLSGPVFHYARLPAYWGTLGRLARALDLQPGERVLDVGCGTGVGTALARGGYVGVDTDLAYLRFARRRARTAGCAFAEMSATALGFRAGAFDKAVLINVAHHLDNALIDRLLLELTRVVHGPVLVLDAAPDAANRLSRFLLAHDRGAHLRSQSALRALLERRYRVERQEVFHNRMGTVCQVLFALRPVERGCAPRPPGGAPGCAADHVGVSAPSAATSVRQWR